MHTVVEFEAPEHNLDIAEVVGLLDTRSVLAAVTAVEASNVPNLPYSALLLQTAHPWSGLPVGSPETAGEIGLGRVDSMNHYIGAAAYTAEYIEAWEEDFAVVADYKFHCCCYIA